MNRPQKCAPQIKKVAPPSVPDNSTYRHSGSSFGSAGYSSSGEDSCFSDTITKGIVILLYFLCIILCSAEAAILLQFFGPELVVDSFVFIYLISSPPSPPPPPPPPPQSSKQVVPCTM